MHTDPMESDSRPFADLAAMLDALGDDDPEREAAAERAVALGRAVSDHVSALCISASIDREALIALARRMYWEFPQLTVASIAALLGVAETCVRPVVGPMLVEGRCRTCRGSFEWMKSSRHALAPSNCPSCRPMGNDEFRQIAGRPL